jgi:predicted naringenin-chalcone synthase
LNRFTQEQAARIAQVLCLDPRQAPLIPTLYRQTGIDGRNLVLEEDLVRDVLAGTRHSRSVFLPKEQGPDSGPTTRERMEVYSVKAPPLAIEAAQHALADSNIAPRNITHLVTVSCTGFAAPGVDIALIRGLGLSTGTERAHIGFMGCHGALNGLRVARGLASADPGAVVLLCAVELCSLHYHYGWDPKRVVGNALFGDGAAAAVVGHANPSSSWKLAAHGASLFPDSDWAMNWEVGDHGFTMSLSTRVPGLVAKNLRPWLERWLARQGETIASVGSWAIHPGGPRVLSAATESLGLRAEAAAASMEILTHHGNMSSPTILFILDALRRRNAPQPCVALAFGPGLAVETAMFR